MVASLTAGSSFGGLDGCSADGSSVGSGDGEGGRCFKIWKFGNIFKASGRALDAIVVRANTNMVVPNTIPDVSDMLDDLLQCCIFWVAIREA